MMKKNSKLYQLLIILLALTSTSLVLASDKDTSGTKEKAALPAAPDGPYRSQVTNESGNFSQRVMQRPRQAMPVPQMAQRPQPMPAPQWAQRPPQQPMPAPNWNQQRQQQMPAPQWAQRPPQQPMRAPNWNQHQSQPMPVPQWAQRPTQQSMPAPNWNQHRQQRVEVPEWVKNPPYGPKPPAWVTNPKPFSGYGYPVMN